MHTYQFPDDVLTREGNFVNDIVIDPDGSFAYMSDVGTGPAPDLHHGGIVGKPFCLPVSVVFRGHFSSFF